MKLKKYVTFTYFNNKTTYVRFNFVLFIAVIFAVTLSSCKLKGGKNINQGEIHYDISYVGEFAFPTEALPRNLVVSFRKDKILFEMTGIGNSGIINLANPEQGVFDTYYSFFNVKKYYYAAKPGETFPGFNSMEGMKVEKTSRTAVICGYNCRNAEVSFPGSDKKYDIWYTEEIDVNQPNEATPFKEINGVLLNFFFIMGEAELHFMCETVYSKELADNLFDRRKDYVRVSKEDMVKFMNTMLDTTSL